MEFILLLLVVTTSINSVSSLICQTCKAIDKATCESKQRPKDCEERQACLILTYTFNNTNLYQKSCSENMSKCAKACENVEPSISKNCEALCCTGRDNCNEIHPESNRRKRTHSSGSQRTSGSNTFVMCGVVVVFMMTRGWFLM